MEPLTEHCPHRKYFPQTLLKHMEGWDANPTERGNLAACADLFVSFEYNFG